jgi:hypothetical protein
LGLGRVQDGLRAFQREFRMVERYVSHFLSPYMIRRKFSTTLGIA